MKRFWKSARAAEVPGGWGVLLDGRPVRLPGGGGLLLPGRALAEAVAAEWDAAAGGPEATPGGKPGGELSFDDVPLTRVAGAATTRIAPDPAPTVLALARFGESDLLCYRAEEPALAARQAERWQPLLDWAALHLDAPLRVTAGLMPVPQPPEALAALQRAVASHPPMELAALGIAVPALGSLVLGLALAAGRIDAAEATALATLDEAHQEALWGADAEALDRRRRIADDVALAERLIALARADAAAAGASAPGGAS